MRLLPLNNEPRVLMSSARVCRGTETRGSLWTRGLSKSVVGLVPQERAFALREGYKYGELRTRKEIMPNNLS